jgi:hypothetical protein
MHRLCRPIGCLLLSLLTLGVPRLLAAQSEPANTTDLATRVEELQRQLDDLRSQLAAVKKESLASSANANAALASTAPSSLSTLLGPTSLSGFVDMYYGYNANQPASRSNSFRSFDGQANQFALNLVELVVDKTPVPTNSRTGYHIALGFGQAINAVNGSEPGGLGFDQYLKEAYFSYLAPVGKGLQVDFGKFVTPAGAEVIETKDNWNYSRGLLFSYAIPYYHFGMRAKYAFNDKYSLTGYVVNGWNNLVDNNTGKTYGMSFGWNATKKINIAQNYMAGPEQGANSNWRQLWDTVVTYSPTAKLSLMANADYGRGDRAVGIAHPVFWSGVAGYVKYSLNPKYAIATRYEYYDDHDGFTTGTAQNFNGITGTFEHTIASHILTRLEFRRDISSRPTFVKGANTPVTSQNTAAAGLVFMFDSREAK